MAFRCAVGAVFAALGLTIGQAAQAVHLPDPVLTLSMNGGMPVAVPYSEDANGNWLVEDFTMTNPGFNQIDPDDPSNDWSVTINAFLDPDPQIVYAASIIDFGAPTTFGFVFQQAIVPTPAAGLVSHSHSSSTTDGGGAAGTLVTAAAPPAGIPIDGDATPEIAVYTVSINGGVSFLNAGLDLSPSFTGAPPSGGQGPFNEGPIVGPAGSGSYDVMRVDVNFTMDGNQDAYTFNGVATVVPEPATVALLGLGLIGLTVAGRRI
jgi:hypothetical protein